MASLVCGPQLGRSEKTVRVLFHCHLWPEGMEGEETPLEENPGRAAHLSMLTRKLGFDTAVAFAPFDASKAYATSRVSSGTDPIRWLTEEIAPFDNLVGFATIDLNAMDACRHLEAALELGLRGVKIHPSICRLDIVDRRHDAFYELVQSHRLPVIFHTGVGRWPWPVRYASPLLVQEVASRFPGLSAIIAHCGGVGFFRETILALQGTPNCYADLALVLEPGGAWHVPESEFTLLRDLGLARKLIYGLDYPWGTAKQVGRDLDVLSDWPIDDALRSGILGRTIAELAGLET
jgi:predicted TIM-barrel fold metal-dependent hydrolase